MVEKRNADWEETKLKLKKGAVDISADGEVTIKDPNLIKRLTSYDIRGRSQLAGDDVSVGVVVSKSF